MGLFVPDYFFENITQISPEFLKELGISHLALDVDNTLTGHGSQSLSPEISAWIEKMKASGFKLMLASNNFEKRVKPFAEKIGLDYISFCCKPSPAWLFSAKKKFGVKKNQVALVGDQIFTDLLAGKLYGATVLLVEPLYDDIKPSIRFKRKLEKPFIKRYHEKSARPKGE